ncbi:hypothetical protein EVAR_88247_1 [Eumeta japonica]|uniref:Uncharacterized protein n=1 Tax=Eumeta variegata TaxID=151549 RepID=A0A4C1YYJ6_EUMVA|nr:hypothetical protein EVAR_88247_1 [Eumeta japonica]
MLSFPPTAHTNSNHLIDLYSVHEESCKFYLRWMDGNPSGKTMTIYDIPGILTTTMPLALTQSSIQAGFRTIRIVPFNSHLFTELDFAPTFVTDRPNPIEAADGPIQNTSTTEDKMPPQSPSILTLEPPEELEEFTKHGSSCTTTDGKYATMLTSTR